MLKFRSRPSVSSRLAWLRRAHDQRGVTLIEVLVAITVLSLIIVPISMVFLGSVRGVATADDVEDRTLDAQRIGDAWARDVQNVDRDGVNAVGASCNGAAAGSQPETHLVSFSWDRASTVGAGVSEKTASWVIVGEGRNMTLVRRYCEGGAPKSELPLAMKIGDTGLAVSDVVRGYTGPGSSGWNDFCPAVSPVISETVGDTCYLQLTGSFEYRVESARRIRALGALAAAAMTPGRVTNIVAAGRNGYLSVFWDEATVPVGSPPVSGYRVYWYLDPQGSPAGNPVELGVGSNAATIPNLSNGVDYWVRVQAGNAVGWGELSDPIGPNAPQPTTPDAPTVTGVTEGNASLTVTWEPNTNDGGSAVTSWRLWARDLNGVITGPVTVNGGATRSGTIPGLVNGTKYTVSVAAVNSLGVGEESLQSAPFSPKTIAGNAVISSQTINNDTADVTLTWTAPANTGGRPITGYQVVAMLGGSVAGTWQANDQVGATNPTLTISGLTLGSTYQFRVETVNEAGSSPGTLGAAMLVRKKPNAPTSVTATASGTGQITLTWVAGTNNGSPITTYTITSSPAVSGFPLVHTNSGPTSRVLTGFTAGTTYTFTVKATNVAGDSPTKSSNAVVATGAPGAPTGVTLVRPAQSFGRVLTLGFTAPSNNGGLPITSYTYNCTSSNGGWGVGGSVTGSGTHTVSGFKDGKSYVCTVKAFNGLDSAWSSNSAAAVSYGECRLPASGTNWIDRGSGGGNNVNSSSMRVRPHYDSWGVTNNERWSIVGFNYSTPCAAFGNGADAGYPAIPSTAVVADATFYVKVSDGADRTNRLYQTASTNWNNATWNSRPAIGTELGSWNADSANWKAINVTGTAQAIKAGTQAAFVIRDTGGGCLLSGSCHPTYDAYANGVEWRPYMYVTYYSDGN